MAIKVTRAFKIKETSGDPNCFLAKGQSGEKGCFQYMPGVYEERAIRVLRYVPPFTKVNEEYVTTLYNQYLIDQGLNAERIALRHNGGHATRCSQGHNRFNVWYDSCEYISKFMAIFNKLS